MRINMPVTQVEHALAEDVSLVSRTDIEGRITYANPSFIQASGYSERELIGQPHNLLRHPDMPAEAFADLWGTLKAGQPWTGVVKNRRKNGDHYWVYANVTPVRAGGAVTGYLSVRTPASREQVAAVEPVYRQFSEGRASHLAIRNGAVVRDDWLGRVTGFRRIPVGVRITLSTWTAAVLILLLGGMGAWEARALAQAAGMSSDLPGLLAGASIAGALLTLMFGMFINRTIVRPLDRALDVAHAIAGGDLSLRFEARAWDETAQLMRALTQMKVNVVAAVSDISANVESIRNAASEIATGNMDLSARTESQASSLEETASSLEELTGTVRQNAESVHHASQLVTSTADIAVRGGDVVGQVIATMSSIKDSSRKISEIISVIDSIAFQTNILALNAAVEAARAGEQGRGFAVVAGEVRNLAQNTAVAAREIKALISDSVGRVEAGRKLVDEAGQAMDDIVTSVQLVADIIAGTATASHEQSAGIDQINQAVAQMDEITQQNAALVEEAAAASAHLHEQADRLVQAASVFHLRPSGLSPARVLQTTRPEVTNRPTGRDRLRLVKVA